MSGTSPATQVALHDAIARDGFAFVHGEAMRARIAEHGALTDWAEFAGTWNDLGLDRYMADGGRYRRRRHAVFAIAVRPPEGGGHVRGEDARTVISRMPHQPHYQSTDYNPLHGGIARWFEPMSDAAAGSHSLRTILETCRSLFGSLAPGTPDWQVEVHQFRIEARQGEQGRPTPEGLHRDGVDYVLVLLVNRQNIASGTTAIHALDGRGLGHFTLTRPFDAAIVDDARVAHGVTPVQPIDPAAPAHRDVLVVTFIDQARRRQEGTGP